MTKKSAQPDTSQPIHRKPTCAESPASPRCRKTLPMLPNMVDMTAADAGATFTFVGGEVYLPKPTKKPDK